MILRTRLIRQWDTAGQSCGPLSRSRLTIRPGTFPNHHDRLLPRSNGYFDCLRRYGRKVIQQYVHRRLIYTSTDIQTSRLGTLRSISTRQLVSTRYSLVTSATGMKRGLFQWSRDENWPTSLDSDSSIPVQRPMKVLKRHSSLLLGAWTILTARYTLTYCRDIKTRLIDSQPEAAAAPAADKRSGVDVNKQGAQSSGGCC